MREKNERLRRVGVLFLAFAAMSMFFVMLSADRGTLVIQHYLSPMVFAFAGMNLYAGSYGRRMDWWLGAFVVGWYALSRVLLGELYLDTSYRSFVDLGCMYLLALPFACVTGDGQRKRGLAVTAVIYVLCFGLCAMIANFAMLMENSIILPWVNLKVGLPGYGIRRMFVFGEPNTDGCLFLICLMLCVWLGIRFRRRWVTVILTILGATFYAAIALGVSRTVMLQTSCYAAGLAVLGALKLRRIPALWKRLGIGIALGAACAVVVYLSFGWVVDGFMLLGGSMRASAETAAPRLVWERSLLETSTLSERLDVCRCAFQMIRENPSILLRGMRNDDLVRTLLRRINVVHTHNAYLQILMHMGLPGLAMALWFTVRAVIVSFRLVFSRKAAFSDQLLAVMLVVLLISTVVEAYLFGDVFTPCNLIFFLMLGYAIEADRTLRA